MLLLLDTCVTLLSLAKTRRPVVPVVQIAKMLFVLLSVVAILVVLCTGARDIVDRRLSWPSDRGCCGPCSVRVRCCALTDRPCADSLPRPPMDIHVD